MWSWWIWRCRITTVPSWWHLPQVNGTLSGETGERGSFAARMSWTPWHAVQPGASGSPRFIARPWSEAACCFASDSWQAPQSTLSSGASCGSSLPWRSAWQFTHSRPPCIDAPKAFSFTNSDTVWPLRSVVKSCCPWQPRQSALPCARAAAGARSTRRSARKMGQEGGGTARLLSIGLFIEEVHSPWTAARGRTWPRAVAQG